MAQQQSRRLGSILFRGAFRILSSHQGALPSSFILSRSFTGSKLFVGGLSYRTDEEGLKNAFASHGEVADVRIITDRESGRSRGFGFVTYLAESDAETALSKMDGHVLDGRIIRVDRASARPPAPRPTAVSSAADGSDSGSGTSSGPPLFESPPPSSPEDWGTIPSFNAEVPQNLESTTPDKSSEDMTNGGDKLSGSSTTSDTSASNQNTSSISTLDGGLPNIESKSEASAVGSSASNISPAASSSSAFDLSNFPAFEESTYEDEPPLPRRRPRPRPRPIPQSSVSNFSFNSPSSEEVRSPFGSSSENGAGIPKAKDQEFDFGLTGIGGNPPQCEPGARPQGGFDINLPAGLKELPPEPPSPPKPKPLFSMFPLRTLPPDDLPYDTPEADNWSDIGKEPPKYDLSMLFGPGKSFIKKDKELHWDPYDFDEDAKLPPEPEATEASA